MAANLAVLRGRCEQGSRRRNDLMANALAAVEAAISEVTKARHYVTRKKSKQVSSGDEIDQLKLGRGAALSRL